MASLLTHIKVQRRNLGRVALYSVEGAAFCMVGVWLFGKTDFTGMATISALFGIGIFFIGAAGVLVTSMSTLRKIDAQATKERH
jgi:sulfite exporter TauE/SafE